MLTRWGRLCWCVVFPADHRQAWMVWLRKGGPQSCTSSEPVRKMGSSLQRKPVLFMSEGSRIHSPVLFSVLSLLWADKFSSYFFFFSGCSAQLVGYQFPNQGLNPGLWQWDCEIQTTETAKEFPDGSISYGWFGRSSNGPLWGSQVAVFSWWISWGCHMGPLNSSSCDLSTWLPWASS